MIRRSNRTLSQLLAIEMFFVALGVSIALIGITAAYYMLDKQELRRLTLEMQVRHVVDAIRRGDNPASWQWVAGSGADAAPYFRFFNPILQGE
jgi:hypothetical protein